MALANRDLLAFDSCLPQIAGLVRLDVINGASAGDRQVDAQSIDRLFAIVFLSSPFTRLSNHFGWQMLDDDRRFNFIAVLSAGTTATGPFHFAILQQLFD